MQLISEQWIFVVANYVRTRSLKDVQQQLFRDRVASTKITILIFFNKYKSQGSSLNLNKDRLGRRRTERTQKNILLLLQENLIKEPRISARNNCLAIGKSTFNRSLNAI